MDVSEQMNASIGALLGELRAPDVNEETRRILRVAWLDGYQCGIESMGDEAIAALNRVGESVKP